MALGLTPPDFVNRTRPKLNSRAESSSLDSKFQGSDVATVVAKVPPSPPRSQKLQ